MAATSNTKKTHVGLLSTVSYLKDNVSTSNIVAIIDKLEENYYVLMNCKPKFLVLDLVSVAVLKELIRSKAGDKDFQEELRSNEDDDDYPEEVFTELELIEITNYKGMEVLISGLEQGFIRVM